MRTRARWGALSVVLMLLWGPTRIVQACPHPCTCYVPSEVHCTFRSLAAVPAGISKHVERINLGFNSIQALSGTSFAGLTKLELLMIHGNDIPSIPDGAFRDLRSLQVLKFSYNKLRVITDKTLQGLENLVRLHVDHNKIEFLHPRALLGLTSLRLLHLEGNLLKQVHPGAFSTFSFLGYFQLSTVRHLYLGENALSSLPDGVLQNMPLLENVYLHGNPWTCTCDMRWFLHWGARDRGILKCKKDKAYEGGQLCAMCSGPQQLQRQEIQKLGDVTCVKPVIQSPLRQNGSRGSEEELEVEDEEEDADSQASLDRLQLPVWNVSLNMTDEHGNTVDLICGIKKPTHLYKVQLNQTEPLEVDINATVALDFECPMIREKYEKLWRLIAYYSEVPLKLHREPRLSNDPAVPYEYRQDSNDDDLYYTGVRARVLAEPEWVTQPSVHLQLDRRHSTARKVLLSYQAHFSQTVSAKDLGQARSRSWVLVEDSGVEQRSQMVLEGKSFQLSCNVRASQSPSIFWILPDGSVLRAPMEDPNSKFSVLSSGQLKVRSAEYLDSGLYQCIVQVPHESDRMLYRVSVQAPVTQPPGGDALTITKSPGESLNLPCSALAIPEPHLSWILPDKRIMNHVSNTSHVYMLDNGTLSIPKVRASDGGLYRCVAINLQGTDHFTVGVMVSQKGPGRNPKRSRRPGGRMSGDVVDDEGGSGVGSEAKAPRRILRPVGTDGFVQTKDEATSGGGKTRKGRRKLKLWNHPEKEPETRVAEGRRGFETRRKVNMAKKQINAEHWADILARVRGKNVPKGTEVPQSMQSTTLPSTPVKVLSLSPALPWPSVSPPETATIVEESSADMSTFKEEEPSLDSMFSTKVTLERDHQEVILAGPEVTSNHPEDVLEKTEDEASTDYDPSIPISIVWPSEASSAPQTFDTFSKEPMHEEGATQGWPTAPGFTSVSPVTSDMDELPLEAISVEASQTEASLYPDAETGSYLVQDKMEDLTSTDLTPTPTWGAVDPTMPESLGELHGAGQRHLKGETDKTQTPEGDLGAQDKPLTRKDMAENSQITKEGAILERDPNSEKKEGMGSVSPIGIGETSPTTLVDQTTTAAPTMTSKPNITPPTTPANLAPRRKSNGRKRLRPHRLRHRHKQTQPMTPEPTEMVSLPSAQASEVTSKDEGSLVMTSGADNTAGASKQLATGTPAQPITKGTSRRKHSRKQNRHRYTTSTVSSRESVPKASSPPEKTSFSSENKQEYGATHSPDTLLSSTVVPLETRNPHAEKGARDSLPTTSKGHLSLSQLQEMVVVTYQPRPDGKEMKKAEDVTDISDHKANVVVSTMSGASMVSSPSGSVSSTMEPFMESEAPPESEATPSRASSLRTGRPWRPESGILASRPQEETQTDLPLWEELENPSLSSHSPSSMTVSTVALQEDISASTSHSNIRPDVSSRQVDTTTHNQHEQRPTTVTAHPVTIPQAHTPTPGLLEDPMSTSPTKVMVPLVETTTRPTSFSPRTSQTPTESKEKALVTLVGVLKTQEPQLSIEGARDLLRPNEVSPPSSKKVNMSSSPKQELVKEAFDDDSPNTLPRGPAVHPHEGRGHISHQAGIIPPRPTPPRWIVKPPHMTTQSSSRHFVTFQPPRHVTNKPEITAFPSRIFPGSKVFVIPKSSTVTTPVPWHRPQTILPSKFDDHGASLFNTIPKVLGSNSLPEQRSPHKKPVDSRPPHHSHGRAPFFFNRTLVFPQLGGTMRPPTPSTPVSVTREKKVTSGPYNRMFPQSVIHIDFGPPAPPLSHPPRATVPPSNNRHIIPPFHPTRSSIPSTASPGQPSRNVHQSSSRIFSSVGGPPASKFWTPGEKPQIVTKSPKSVSVTVDMDAMFPCEATGKPPPFVTWTKVSTGALLTPSTRTQRFQVLRNGTLLIRNVQTQDHGQYVCSAKNLYGVDTMPVLLTVTTQQPQILASHYQDVTVYLGDTIAMECLAKGTPAPQISWIFPDRRVWHTVSPVEGRVTLHENRTLSIKEASFSDRGVYKCVASNAAGADSLAIRLHVAALPPVIQQEKQENISLPPGLSIHIHCTAKAAPLPSVRWVLGDGTQVRPSQFVRGNLFVFPNGTLYIRHLAPKDSGRYECVAANLVGSARRTVQLTVQRSAANARITATSPRKTDVRYGETLRLDCSASGDPWPRTQWRLPSQRMVDALFSFDPRVKVFPNGTLVVTAVTDKDSGDYLCVVRNDIGDDYVALKVNVMMQAARIKHKDENDHRVSYGSDLHVDCVATGLPDPEISWSLPDGSQVNPFMQSDDVGGGRAKRFVVFNNGTLYFNEVGMREAGDYTCVAQNQVGKDEMKVRVRVVAAPAEIRNKTYSVVQVPYGDVVTVSCHAKGDPTPRVTWLSPTNRLIPASSEKYQVSQDGTLLIRKAQRSDSGNYTCVVRNTAGEDRKAVWVQVRVQAPQINGSPNAITTVREVAEGGSRKLIDCRAEGIPAPRALWAFPEGVVLPAPYYGNRVTVHRNGTLDIRNLRPSDSVQLTCIARNEGGEARLIVQLTVLDPAEKPVFRDPVEERIIASAGHTISLNCSASGAPAPTLLWLLPNGTELPSGRRLRRFFHELDGRLHIAGLSPADAGPYRCVARNPSGHSERLVSLQVGLQPAAHNAMSVTHGSTLHLHCPLRAGRPAPVSWTLPNGLVLGVPQEVGRFVLWDNGTLTVHEASALDRGTYACKVDTAVANIPVIVIAYPPRITSEAAPVIYARTGSTVQLSCLAVGIPKPQVSWELPDGARLAAGTQPRTYRNKVLQPQGALTVQLASSRDVGFYECSVENAVGRDSKTTYVHVF